MNRRKEILDELNDAAPELAGIENQHPYRVPAGYFESLPSLILLRIKTENAGSAKEELDVISPLLGGLSKKMPYGTPDGYFESLTPSALTTPAEIKTPARVVKMFQPQRRFRMAAAAVVVGVIAIAAWLFVGQSETKDYAMKTDVEVQKELQPKVNELSDNELANFVESNTILATLYSNGQDEISEDDVKLMLAEIPDQELEKYLDQNTLKEKFN